MNEFIASLPPMLKSLKGSNTSNNVKKLYDLCDDYRQFSKDYKEGGGGGKDEELRKEVEKARKGLGDVNHTDLDERITADVNTAIELAKKAGLVLVEGDPIESENTLMSFAEDLTLYGQTIKNLSKMKDDVRDIANIPYYMLPICKTSTLKLNNTYTFCVDYGMWNLNVYDYTKLEFVVTADGSNVIGDRPVCVINGVTSTEYEVGTYSKRVKFTIVFKDFKGFANLALLPLKKTGAPEAGKGLHVETLNSSLLEGDYMDTLLPTTYVNGLGSIGEYEKVLNLVSHGRNLQPKRIASEWEDTINTVNNTIITDVDGGISITPLAGRTYCHYQTKEPITLRPWTTHTFSFKAKCINSQGSGYPNVGVGEINTNADEIRFNVVVNSTSYKDYSMRITTGITGNVYIKGFVCNRKFTDIPMLYIKDLMIQVGEVASPVFEEFVPGTRLSFTNNVILRRCTRKI